MQKNTVKLLVSFFLLTMLTSCTAIFTSQMTVEKGAIPPDFGKTKATLLCVITGKKSYDRYMEKNVKNNYFGKYIFVKKEEIEKKKYSDVNKYRYVLDRVSYISQGAELPSNTFYVKDRKENKDYEANISSGAFGKLISAYAKQLEKTRLKYQ